MYMPSYHSPASPLFSCLCVCTRMCAFTLSPVQCRIWCESSRGALEWKPGSGAEWSYYDTRHKHLNSSSFFCFSVLPCCSTLNQPGFASCCFFSPLSVSFLCLTMFLYTAFHLVELFRASMDQCNNTFFLFFLSLTLCFFFSLLLCRLFLIRTDNRRAVLERSRSRHNANHQPRWSAAPTTRR